MKWRPSEAEDVIRLTAAFGLSCYVMGLLIVNAYLFKFGAAEFSLLRPRFILSGAVAFGVLLLGFAMYESRHFSWRALAERKRGNNPTIIEDFKVAAAIWLVFPFIAFFAACYWLGVSKISFGSVSIPPWIYFPVVAIVFAFSVHNFLIALKHDADDDFGDDTRQDLRMNVQGQSLSIELSGRDLFEARDKFIRTQEFRAEIEAKLQETMELLQENRQKLQDFRKLAISGVIFPAALAILAFGFFVYGFGVSFLPSIPEQFGGTKPRSATLIFAPDFVNSAVDLGLLSDDSARISHAIDLIWHGEETS